MSKAPIAGELQINFSLEEFPTFFNKKFNVNYLNASFQEFIKKKTWDQWFKKCGICCFCKKKRQFGKEKECKRNIFNAFS